MKKVLLIFVAVIGFTVGFMSVSVSAAVKCGDNVVASYNSETKTITISGTGPMYDYSINEFDELEPSGFSYYNAERIIIAEGVTHIGTQAFYNCPNVESVWINDTVTSIGNAAFYERSKLITISFEGQITEMGANVFFGTAYYNDPDKWTGDGLYINGWLVDVRTTATGEFVVQEGARIARSAFRNCTSIESVVMPETATQIDKYAFQYSGIKTMVLPDSVTNIGEYAFYNCTNLESIVIPASITTINESIFRNCTSLKDINLPNSVTTIGASAFYNCTSLESIEIPDSVTTIDAYAFEYCTSLESIVIPTSITTINQGIFRNCTSLKDINLPNSVTTIGASAFEYCTSLESIEIPDSVTTIDAYAFYKCTSLESIVIPTSITTINKGIFGHCTSLKDTNLPNSVTTIGAFAFYSCTNLESIEIPDSVTTIEAYAFAYCTNLENIITSNQITKLEENTIYDTAYYNNEENWQDGLLYLDGYLLGVKAQDLPGDKVTIKAGIRAMESNLFAGITSLKTVILNEPLRSIPEDAFYSCKNLNILYIPKSVEEIANAFSNCENLKCVYYGGSEEDWCNLQTKSYQLNNLYKNGGVYFSKEEITPEIGKTTLSFAPMGVDVGSVISVVSVKNGVSTSYSMTYSGESTVTFEIEAGFDSIKILVWKSYDSMQPLMEYATVKIDD